MDLLLNNREILDLGKGLQGVRIECIDGRCWLTQSGDDRDHILGAGDNYMIRTRGRLIITAMEPCRLLLVQMEHQDCYLNPFKIVNGALKGRMAQISS